MTQRAQVDVRQDSQTCIHRLEGVLGLFEEAKDNAPRELPFVLVIVHLENLLERHGINVVAEIR